MINPYGRNPYYTPGGRGVNPLTGSIGNMPGGMDYLAGLGPAPAGVNLPDLPPIVHFANFGPFLPYSNSNFNPAAMRALRAAQFGRSQVQPSQPDPLLQGIDPRASWSARPQAQNPLSTSQQNAAVGTPIFGGLSHFYSH